MTPDKPTRGGYRGSAPAQVPTWPTNVGASVNPTPDIEDERPCFDNSLAALRAENEVLKRSHSVVYVARLRAERDALAWLHAERAFTVSWSTVHAAAQHTAHQAMQKLKEVRSALTLAVRQRDAAMEGLREIADGATWELPGSGVEDNIKRHAFYSMDTARAAIAEVEKMAGGAQ